MYLLKFRRPGPNTSCTGQFERSNKTKVRTQVSPRENQIEQIQAKERPENTNEKNAIVLYRVQTQFHAILKACTSSKILYTSHYAAAAAAGGDALYTQSN